MFKYTKTLSPRMRGWITKTLHALMVHLLLMGLILALQKVVDQKRLKSLCGEWTTVLPHSKIIIREQQGYYLLTSYRIRAGEPVIVSNHQLRGVRRLHFGSGKDKTYLWLSEDGNTLRLLPGQCYKRKDFSTHNNKNNEKKTRTTGCARREPVAVPKAE